MTAGQWTPDQLASYLTQSYRLVLVALAVAIIVELLCFRRTRAFNAWLNLLAGATVCLQTVVVMIQLTMHWDDVAIYEVVVRVTMLGFSGMALVGLWLGVRHVWIERSRSGSLVAWFRAAAASLLAYAFCYQMYWGSQMLDLFSGAQRG